MYYSQFSQDKIINENYTNNGRKGVFVDVGAHNGVLYSNSYFFEKELDWSGICIEPMKKEFAKLEEARSSINVNACAFSKDGILQFKEVEDKPSGAAHSYNMLSGVADHHSTKDRVKNFSLASNIIDVPCVQLKTLFRQHNISVIDYLSIDTEGSEIEVLKGIDFRSVHINLIGLEHNQMSNILDDSNEILSGNNFTIAETIKCDILYQNKLTKWSWEQQ